PVGAEQRAARVGALQLLPLEAEIEVRNHVPFLVLADVEGDDVGAPLLHLEREKAARRADVERPLALEVDAPEVLLDRRPQIPAAGHLAVARQVHRVIEAALIDGFDFPGLRVELGLGVALALELHPSSSVRRLKVVAAVPRRGIVANAARVASAGFCTSPNLRGWNRVCSCRPRRNATTKGAILSDLKSLRAILGCPGGRLRSPGPREEGQGRQGRGDPYCGPLAGAVVPESAAAAVSRLPMVTMPQARRSPAVALPKGWIVTFMNWRNA